MKAGRLLLVLFCLMALIPGGGLVLAQQTEEDPPRTEETKPIDSKVEDPKKDPADEGKPKAPKPSGHTERVTVTATRVETDLMKTPVAVSVFGQDEMDREGVQNLVDLAQKVPNMDIAVDNSQSTPIISMRGVRSTNTTELGDSAVGVHLDGVYSPRMQGILALMFDNERVEVLRGPQGTLFGRNSTVGSINIVTAKPSFDGFSASAVVRAGNWNSRETSAIFNLPVNDKFAVRFSGRMFSRDSYLDGYWDPNQYDQRRVADLVANADVIAPGSIDPTTGETQCTSPRCQTRTQKVNWWANTANNGVGYEIRELVPADPADFYMNADEWAFRASALWKPTDDVTLDFAWQRYRSDGAGGVDLVNCEKLRGRPNYEAVFDEDPLSPNFGNITGYVQVGTADCKDMFPKDDTYQAVVSTPGRLALDIDYLRSRLTWDLNDKLRFVYLTGYEDLERESAQDFEVGLNAWDQAFFFLPGTGSRSWSHEVQLQSYTDSPFNWIAGANAFRERTSTLGYFDNTIDPKSLFAQPNRSTNAYAAFAQGTYAYSPKWFVTLGYRYSQEKKEDKGGRSYTCSVGNGCAPQVPREQIIPGLTAFDREGLDTLPIGYFGDPANYPEFQANDNKGRWANHDFRVGLDYDKNENTLFYGYLATGFKAGGIGDVFEEINPRTQELIRVETAFDPEKVTTLEFGVKTRLFNRKLNLSANYFYSDYEDHQYASVGAIAFTERLDFIRDDFGNLIPDPNGGFLFGWVPAPIVAFFTQNVPGAQIQGVELEYDWTPWPGGRIKGYFSWLDTRIAEDWWTKWSYDPVSYFNLSFDQSINPQTDVLKVNLRGNDLAVSPPFKVNVTIDHAFLMPGKRTTLVPWITAHWEDDSYLTIWNVDKHTDDLDFVIFDQDIRFTDDKRKAWSMVHAGLRIYHGNWTTEFFGYNLTDEVVQWWGGAAEQVSKGSFSTPRHYGFHVGTKF